MSVYEWITMFCFLTLAVCAIVFPILFLAQRKHQHRVWLEECRRIYPIVEDVEHEE